MTDESTTNPQKPTASEFIFAIQGHEDAVDEGCYHLCITPRKPFEERNECSDQHLNIDHLLPTGLTALYENTWEVSEEDFKPAALAKELVKRGFTWNEKFQEACNRDSIPLPQINKAMAKILAAQSGEEVSGTKKKETSSDALKDQICEAHGGKPDDWKRVSKKKNPQGEYVREFKNSKTGETIAVTGENYQPPGQSPSPGRF